MTQVSYFYYSYCFISLLNFFLIPQGLVSLDIFEKFQLHFALIKALL